MTLRQAQSAAKTKIDRVRPFELQAGRRIFHAYGLADFPPVWIRK